MTDYQLVKRMKEAGNTGFIITITHTDHPNLQEQGYIAEGDNDTIAVYLVGEYLQHLREKIQYLETNSTT